MITTYEELMQKYETPLKAAIGLGIIKPTTKGKRRTNATSRVSNWARIGLPKRDKKLNKAFAQNQLVRKVMPKC